MAQFSIIKQMNRQVSRGSAGYYQADEQAVSRGSVFDYQADEQAGVVRTSRRLSSRIAGRCHASKLAAVKQMNRQVSCGSAVDYQPNEQAGVARLSCRISIR